MFRVNPGPPAATLALLRGVVIQGTALVAEARVARAANRQSTATRRSVCVSELMEASRNSLGLYRDWGIYGGDLILVCLLDEVKMQNYSHLVQAPDLPARVDDYVCAEQATTAGV